MGELKSAWEIAQERANRLGKLSAEEKEQQERQRCRQIGQALAQKWLDGSQHLDISAELSKHEEQDRNIIKQNIIERLAEAIQFATSRQEMNNTKRAVEAISKLDPELQPEAEQIRRLVQEYEEAERKTRQELESSYRETLHQLRISGTAVDAINVEATQEWQLARQRLVEALTPKLNCLKKALTSH